MAANTHLVQNNHLHQLHHHNTIFSPATSSSSTTATSVAATMCCHKTEVDCVNCPHMELRTTDPCGNAPDGLWSGQGALACDKYEPRQIVPRVGVMVGCSKCEDTPAAERVRREAVMTEWNRR